MTGKQAHRPSRELIERLAADYTVGTMTGGARRRFQRALREDPALEREVLRWQQDLLPLDQRLKPLAPRPELWQRIEARAFGSPSAGPAAAGSPIVRVQRWWQRLLAPVPAGALALGLLLGSLAPGLWTLQQGDGETQLPESYVGVLATADGKPGLIVSSLRRGQTVDLKRVAAVSVPAGQTLYLWTLDGAGRAAGVGALPSGGFVSLKLPGPAEQVFQRAVELAVSIEPLGSTPAQPSGAYVYRGLCGKLWKLPPPQPPTPGG